jgi:hypothetical protein
MDDPLPAIAFAVLLGIGLLSAYVKVKGIR